MYKHPLLNRDKMSPQEALDILIEGNHRFTNNLTVNKDMLNFVSITKDRQHTLASFLSCSDSRAPVEMLFDQALGDIFSVRLAGNIASDKVIGSLEFSSKYLGSKFLISLSCCLASYHVTAGTLGQLEIKQRVVLPRATMLQLAVGY